MITGLFYFALAVWGLYTLWLMCQALRVELGRGKEERRVRHSSVCLRGGLWLLVTMDEDGRVLEARHYVLTSYKETL